MMRAGLELDDLTLAAARKGDVRACERIYRTFRQPAYNLAARVCGCRDLAEDITQDAFITAFRRIRQFRGDAPFWGWLRRVVVNHAISALRKRPNQPDQPLEDHLAPVTGDQGRLGDAMDLEQALASLGHEDRAVVWLHDVEGYRHAEIAQLFGMTESFSKTRLSRARARLREVMAAAHESQVADATG